MALDISGINYFSLLFVTKYITNRLSLRVLGPECHSGVDVAGGCEAIACLLLSPATSTDAQLTRSFVVCLGCQLHTLIMAFLLQVAQSRDPLPAKLRGLPAR